MILEVSPSLFTCFHSRPMDAHLVTKTTISTTCFLSEITENYTDALYNSCRGTTKAIETNIEKKRLKYHVSMRLTMVVFVYTNCYMMHKHDY